MSLCGVPYLYIVTGTFVPCVSVKYSSVFLIAENAYTKAHIVFTYMDGYSIYYFVHFLKSVISNKSVLCKEYPSDMFLHVCGM